MSSPRRRGSITTNVEAEVGAIVGMDPGFSALLRPGMTVFGEKATRRKK